MESIISISITFVIILFGIIYITYAMTRSKTKKEISVNGIKTKAKVLGYYYDDINIITDDIETTGRMILSFNDENGLEHIIIERPIMLTKGKNRPIAYKKYIEGIEINIAYRKLKNELLENKVAEVTRSYYYRKQLFSWTNIKI